MLRWCQSTVRALDECGTSTSIFASLFHSSTAARRHAFEHRHTLHTHTKWAPRSVTQDVDAPLALTSSLVARRITGTTRTSYATDSRTRANSGTTPVNSESPAIIEYSRTMNLADCDPVAILSNFLSSRISSSQTSHKHKFSASTLKTLYASAKADFDHLHLRRLSPKQLTDLISLLGTLSLQRPWNSCIYFSKYASQVEDDGNTANTTHWAFVLEVARDKETLLGQSLNGTDRYWVMRAQLAKIVLAEGETPLEHDDLRLRALSHATQQYLRIWRHTPDPEVHLPYLHALLALRSPEYIATLVQRLCKILELYANPHSHLLDLLWNVISRHAHDLTPPIKARILAMVSTRLSGFPSSPLPPTPSHPHRIPLKTAASTLKPERPERLMSRSADLSAALGTALFPSYIASPRTRQRPELHEWATQQVRRAFALTVAPDTRWGNLLLLAISKTPQLPVSVSVPAPIPTAEEDALVADGDAMDWRPVMVLAALEQTLRETSRSESRNVEGDAASSVRESIRNIVRPLWRVWKDAEDGARPLGVTRAIVTAFFRVAEKVLDGPLVEGCHRLCVARGLFEAADHGSGAEERMQVTELLAAYVVAAAESQGTGWQDVLVASVPPESRGEVLEALLWHFLSRRASDNMYAVYAFAKDHGYQLTNDAIHATSLTLVSSRTWHLAVPFFDRPNVSREQTEELLVAILRVFQLERREYVDPPLVKLLGDTLWKLYAHRAPEDRFRYPIRFFFSIMIASGHPVRAVSIVEAIHRQAPLFFTTRLFLRLMRTLVRFRQLHLTSRVLQLVPSCPTGAAGDLRRKLTLSLARTGAHAKARSAHTSGFRINRWQTTRETMAHAVAFKVRSPSTQHALTIVPILARRPTHGPTIKYAATLLVSAHRTYAARKVLERARPHLDSKTSTAIGNTILHGFLKQHRLRNGRLVRHTLRTKELLERHYGFTPDRVTINVIIKAILRWRHAIDAPKVKALFDHMVRCGYPASARWRSNAGVPFGTPLAAPAFSVPAMEEAISFERHVRPLYKMFVKALYVRQDVRTARTVLAILKEEEVAAMRRREDRNRARKLGLVRKKMRMKEREQSGRGL
ncbi:hypothetical protein D9615_009529 [Tricholomella constricta]|uniref:Uncharacterized protein n=1 Tax=Tricholomella constricta TaxID=117010 RepID=A0A8H5GVQ2_9AGAR|nr:hypothetical protein D9615_009529 [Tricholomella constricta]